MSKTKTTFVLPLALIALIAGISAIDYHFPGSSGAGSASADETRQSARLTGAPAEREKPAF